MWEETLAGEMLKNKSACATLITDVALSVSEVKEVKIVSVSISEIQFI